MRTQTRSQTWLAGLAFVLVGCGQPEAPKAPSAAPPTSPPAAPIVVEPVVKEKTPAPPASPASLVEATRVIDLRKFPLPDGGKDLYKSAAVPKGDRGKDIHKSASSLSYVLRRSDGAKLASFYRDKLTEAGWKIIEAPASKDYFEFTGSKQGFILSGGVYENRAAGELAVTITNHGTIDSRSLPRVAMTELKDNDASRTIYMTDAKPDAVMEFMRAELKKGGWREVRDQTGTIDMEPGFPVHLRFIQRGTEIGLSVEDKKGKTEVWNIVRLLNVELPIMPEAKGVIQFLGYAHNVHLYYAIANTSPEQVLEFYRKELPALGWTMKAGTDKIADGKAKMTLESPGREPLKLELLADKAGTMVLIAGVPKE